MHRRRPTPPASHSLRWAGSTRSRIHAASIRPGLIPVQPPALTPGRACTQPAVRQPRPDPLCARSRPSTALARPFSQRQLPGLLKLRRSHLDLQQRLHRAGRPQRLQTQSLQAPCKVSQRSAAAPPDFPPLPPACVLCRGSSSTLSAARGSSKRGSRGRCSVPACAAACPNASSLSKCSGGQAKAEPSIGSCRKQVPLAAAGSRQLQCTAALLKV